MSNFTLKVGVGISSTCNRLIDLLKITSRYLLILAFILFFTPNISAQCTEPSCVAKTVAEGANGPDPCAAKLYCSNSGAVQTGLINCTNAADTDGCGVSADADHSAVSLYSTADPTVTELFSGGEYNTENYLQWIVFATPPTVLGTKIQGVGAVDSWWLFHAGSVSIDPDGLCGNADPNASWYDAACIYDYPTVEAALTDPARCDSFDSSNLITGTNANQWEPWENENADIDYNVYNIYYIALFWESPTNGSLNFKVKECVLGEPCTPLVTNCPENQTEDSCQTQDSIDTAFESWLAGFNFSEGENPIETYSYSLNGVDFTIVNDVNLIPVPDNCGGTITVRYEVNDDCNDSFSCERMFTVPAYTDDLALSDKPTDVTTDACEDPTTKFNAWIDALNAMSASGGCNAMVAYDVTPSYDLLTAGICDAGQIITIMINAKDDCGETDPVTAKFTVVPDTEDPVIVDLQDYTICNDPFPDVLTTSWSDNCSDGADNLVSEIVGEIINIDECTQERTYTFTVMDACGNSDTETTTITREIDKYTNCETAFAKLENSNAICFLDDGFIRWGWTNQITEGTDYNLPLYAGAAQCEITKGALVGNVHVEYYGNTVTVTYNIDEGYVMSEAHVYVGCDKYPTLKKGKTTVAPGKFTFNAGSLDHSSGITVTFDIGDYDGSLYVIAHAVTCQETCICSEPLGLDDGKDFGTKNVNINCVEDNVELSKTNEFNAYPVPIVDVLNVQYKYDYKTDVKIQVYDLKGMLISSETDSQYKKGEIRTKQLDLSRVEDQALIIRLITNKEVNSKMVILKTID